MSKLATCRGTRFLGQVAAVAILAGTAAGCSSDVTRFDGLFGETDNQASIVSNRRTEAQPDMMSTGSIQTQPAYRPATVTNNTLPPPPGATASNAPFVRQTPAQTDANATNWSPKSGTTITARDGDTVAVLSRRYGISEQSLLTANGLAPGAQLHAGQPILIPGASNAQSTTNQAAAQVAPMNGAASASPTAPGPSVLGQLPPSKPAMPKIAAAEPVSGTAYTVKPGDSLGRIAAAHGLKSADLLRANGMAPDQSVRVGQVLRIPAATPSDNIKLASASPMATFDSDTQNGGSLAPAKPAAPQVAAAVPSSPAVASAVTTTAPATKVSAPVQSAADGSFRWPVRGRVISGFGVKPDGDRNDGINIEVPEGTPIKAAEGGEVIYAGNELKGFGNLVLVKHTNGFVSAYAHASEILVRRGDQISRGQTIAKVGATGNVNRPQLHFELREGNKPVDPLPYLSG